MDEHYDVIVLGTGLSECVLSGLLSMEGKKVLHLDKNEYYGGECASLSLAKLFERFRGNASDSEKYGKDRDYNIDIVPKFLMANGGLTEILVHTDVTRYLEFQQISGSFVYKEGSGICKVPATEYEAVTSSLMGFFEKRRAKRFFEFLQNMNPENPMTWEKMNLMTTNMNEIFKAFGLEPGTQDFIGHALALHLDEGYLERPALDTCRKIKLYMSSMLRFGKSPYVYPLYGLSELPQAFARLSAIYGGTYMLGQPIDEILYHDDGRVKGVKSGDKMATCNDLFADPSYFQDRSRLAHKVIRAICLLDHPIPSTNNSDSCQIIIPQRQLNRKYDVYITCLSSSHQICAQGYYVAMVSTIIETSTPEKEIDFALSLLGPILEKFVWTTDMLEPTDDGKTSHIYLTKSYDATSHFETVYEEIKEVYHRYAGKPLEIKKRPTADEEQEALKRSLGSINDV